jgi:hypothetical protein
MGDEIMLPISLWQALDDVTANCPPSLAPDLLRMKEALDRYAIDSNRVLLGWMDRSNQHLARAEAAERQLAEAREREAEIREAYALKDVAYELARSSAEDFKAQLAAQRERDGRDAERYRWLRHRKNACVSLMPRGNWFPDPADLDAAIDAALKDRP